MTPPLASRLARVCSCVWLAGSLRARPGSWSLGRMVGRSGVQAGWMMDGVRGRVAHGAVSAPTHPRLLLAASHAAQHSVCVVWGCPAGCCVDSSHFVHQHADSWLAGLSLSTREPARPTSLLAGVAASYSRLRAAGVRGFRSGHCGATSFLERPWFRPWCESGLAAWLPMAAHTLCKECGFLPRVCVVPSGSGGWVDSFRALLCLLCVAGVWVGALF